MLRIWSVAGSVLFVLFAILWGTASDLTAASVYSSSGVANRGYDVVAYWSLDATEDAVVGLAEHSVEHAGNTYHFATAENAELFQADPARYLPQYNGYCAWAAAEGYVASVDPDAWSIYEGKLYLNYSDGVRRTWLSDRDTFIEAGDRNWPNLQP